MKIGKILLVITLLLIGFFVRCYKINGPIADWHSFRQADTASVTRNYLNNGLDLLRPTYHDLSNIQSGLENPHGYRMVEFPIYNYLSLSVHHLLTFFNQYITIEFSSRITSILTSLIAGVFLYLFAFKLTKSFLASIIVLSVYLFLPFNIYYSRAILPESTANMFMVGAIYFFNINVIISAIFFALAILVKPYTALLAFPLLAYFSYLKLSKGNFKINFVKLFIFSLIALLPFAWWRLWIQQFPAGIPVSAWLFNGGNMRFHPAWFRWLFYERLGKLILGSYGTIFLILGFAYLKNRSQATCLALFVGILLYFSVIARGNIQHDYYQALTIPAISLISGFGIYYLYNFIFKNKIVSALISLVLFIFMISFSWFQVKDYYLINNSKMIDSANIAKTLIPANSLVVAPYNGDTAFLYQTGHSGWPNEIYDLPQARSYHPQTPIYLISINNDKYTNDLALNHQVIKKTADFTILDLSYELKK